VSNDTIRDLLILLVFGSFLITAGALYKEGMIMPKTVIEWDKEI
jgi:hypothetical protein